MCLLFISTISHSTVPFKSCLEDILQSIDLTTVFQSVNCLDRIVLLTMNFVSKMTCTLNIKQARIQSSVMLHPKTTFEYT